MENKNEKAGGIEIAPASPEDVVGMQEVFYKTWLATYPNEEVGVTVDDVEDFYKDSLTEETLTKRRERIAKPPEGESLLLAKIGGKVVGLCRVQKSKDRNQLRALYVLPDFQGKGVG